MTQEHLYRPKGAGHDAPGRDRRGYKGPEGGLHRCFVALDAWMRDTPMMIEPEDAREHYDRAMGMLPDLSGVDLGEAHYILKPFEGEEGADRAGLFLSAIHNKHSNRNIVFNPGMEDAFDFIGYGLRKGKIMVIDCNVGTYLGQEARGAMLLWGDCLNSECKPLYDAYGAALFNFGDIDTTLDFKEGMKDKLVTVGGGIGSRYLQIINFGYMRSTSNMRNSMMANCGSCRRVDGNGSIILTPEDAESGIGDGVRERNDLVMDSAACDTVPGLKEYLEEARANMGPGNSYESVFSYLESNWPWSRIRDILHEAGKWPYNIR